MLRPVRIRNYLAMMNSLGFSAEQILHRTGIESPRLQDPTYLITAAQCSAAISNILHHSGDSGIGFDIGTKSDLISLGITGYTLITCRIVRETLEVWTRYSEPLLGIMSKYQVDYDTRGDLVITVVEPIAAHPTFVFCVEELLGLINTIGEVESGVRPQFVRLEFPYSAPLYRQRYDEIFDCPISFDADHARFTISKDWINLPLLSNDDEFHRICVEHCGHILQQMKYTSPISSQLRHLFLSCPQNVPSLDEAASELGMSSRTLRRRLHVEACSYQAIVREFRSDLACEYLRSTTLSPKEVTYMLGFSDVHSFRRAFKMWTGRTASEYRSSMMPSRRTEVADGNTAH